MNIEKLAQRYEDIINNETKLHDENDKNEEFVMLKLRELLRHDSPTLIMNDLLSFSDNVPVLLNTSDAKRISSSIDKTNLQLDIVATKNDVVKEINDKVSTQMMSNNDGDAYPASQEDDEHSVISSAKRLYELSTADSPINKKLKTLDYEQKQRNYILKTRRLFELYHATRCKHDYVNYTCPCSESKHCIEMKRLWNHMENCHNDPCQYPHCQSSRNVLTHYQKCKYKRCPICSSFKLQISNKINTERKHQPPTGGNSMSLDTHSLSSINLNADTASTKSSHNLNHHPFHEANHCIVIEGESNDCPYSPVSINSQQHDVVYKGK